MDIKASIDNILLKKAALNPNSQVAIALDRGVDKLKSHVVGLMLPAFKELHIKTKVHPQDSPKVKQKKEWISTALTGRIKTRVQDIIDDLNEIKKQATASNQIKDTGTTPYTRDLPEKAFDLINTLHNDSSNLVKLVDRFKSNVLGAIEDEPENGHLLKYTTVLLREIVDDAKAIQDDMDFIHKVVRE